MSAPRKRVKKPAAPSVSLASTDDKRQYIIDRLFTLLEACSKGKPKLVLIEVKDGLCRCDSVNMDDEEVALLLHWHSHGMLQRIFNERPVLAGKP